MKEIKIGFDNTNYRRKPSDSQFHSIKECVAERVRSFDPNHLKSMATLIGREGCSFCPATFKMSFYDTGMLRDNFKQMQLFVLDFNGNLSFEKVLSRADRYEIPILFAYETLGSSNQDRFRVVFLYETPIRKVKESEVIIEALLTIFPEADKKSRDVTQVYLGGKKLIHFDNTVPTLNTEWLFMNMALYLNNTSGPSHYKSKIVEFSRQTGIALTDKKLPYISITKNHSESSVDSRSGKISPKCSIEDSYGEKLPKLKYNMNFNYNTIDSQSKISSRDKHSASHRSYRADMLKNVSSSCSLYQDFESGNRILSNYKLLGLATNLNQIESGPGTFKKILSSTHYFGNDEWKYDNWKFYLKYIKDRVPQPCSFFCPYQDKCPHGKNILSTAKIGYHQAEKIANYNQELVSLDEAWKDFNKIFTYAIASDKLIWHIIKSQTALGKTEAVLRFLKNSNMRVLIVVPTNKLK